MEKSSEKCLVFVRFFLRRRWTAHPCMIGRRKDGNCTINILILVCSNYLGRLESVVVVVVFVTAHNRFACSVANPADKQNIVARSHTHTNYERRLGDVLRHRLRISSVLPRRASHTHQTYGKRKQLFDFVVKAGPELCRIKSRMQSNFEWTKDESFFVLCRGVSVLNFKWLTSKK